MKAPKSLNFQVLPTLLNGKTPGAISPRLIARAEVNADVPAQIRFEYK